jgi:hypothetical protein
MPIDNRKISELLNENFDKNFDLEIYLGSQFIYMLYECFELIKKYYPEATRYLKIDIKNNLKSIYDIMLYIPNDKLYELNGELFFKSYLVIEEDYCDEDINPMVIPEHQFFPEIPFYVNPLYLLPRYYEPEKEDKRYFGYVKNEDINNFLYEKNLLSTIDCDCLRIKSYTFWNSGFNSPYSFMRFSAQISPVLCKFGSGWVDEYHTYHNRRYLFDFNFKLSQKAIPAKIKEYNKLNYTFNNLYDDFIAVIFAHNNDLINYPHIGISIYKLKNTLSEGETNFLFEYLGEIFGDDVSELHEFMIEENHNFLWVKFLNNNIKILGGISEFYSIKELSNLNFPVEFLRCFE